MSNEIYSNAMPTTEPITAASIMAAMQKMRETCPPVNPIAYVFTHPNNVPRMKAELQSSENNLLFSTRVTIQESYLIPERDIKEKWYPPEGGKFTEYDVNDEGWMRPLGLGTVKQVDCEALFIAVKKRMDDAIFKSLLLPESLLAETRYSSYYRY